MSLAALNYPPLVASAGIGLGLGLPLLEKLTIQSPWTAVKIASLLSYGINFISVSRPGRLDGEAVDGTLSPRNGRTLVAPAGWAFAIWGPIFLGELIFVTSQLFIPETAPIVPLLKRVSGPFVAAQIFQSLWCAAFRKKYQGNLMFISTGFLAATAYSLSKAHAIFSLGAKMYSGYQYFFFFLPISLHFGWTTAASLVNLNGAVAMKDSSSEKLIAIVGHASVIGASALGSFIAITRSAPVFGGVISWALLAVADSMKKRLASATSSDKKEKNVTNIYGASTQLFLSRLGAFVSAAASFLSVTVMFLNPTIASKSVPSP